MKRSWGERSNYWNKVIGILLKEKEVEDDFGSIWWREDRIDIETLRCSGLRTAGIDLEELTAPTAERGPSYS